MGLKIKNQGDTGRATLHDWHVIFYGTAVDPQPGSPIKPNYNESKTSTSTILGNGNGRKVELGKNSAKVKFTNLSKQDTLNNLAKICPSCFKGKTNGKNMSNNEKKPIKLTNKSTPVTTDPDENPMKSSSIANIAQVCPQCFKKQSKTPIAETKKINADTTLAEFEGFEEFEAFDPADFEGLEEFDPASQSTSEILISPEQLEENEPDDASTIDSKTDKIDIPSILNPREKTNDNIS